VLNFTGSPIHPPLSALSDHYLLRLSPSLSQIAVLYIQSIDHLDAQVIAECIALWVLATASPEISVL
jgi:hypothetical protein